MAAALSACWQAVSFGLPVQLAQTQWAAHAGLKKADEQLRQEKDHHEESLEVQQKQHEENMQQAHSSFGQAQALHTEGLNAARDMHMQALQHAQAIHHEQLKEGCQQALHLQQIQMFHDAELARWESERDKLANRTYQTQTLLIVNTLMFGCCFAIIVEGMPPPETSTFALYGFTLCLGTALSSLLMSIWFAMLLQTRMTKYKIHTQEQRYTCHTGKHPTFTEYFRCHCKKLETATSCSFYVGTIALALTAATLFIIRMEKIYSSPAAGWLFGGLTLSGVFVVLFVRLILPAKTYLAEEKAYTGFIKTDEDERKEKQSLWETLSQKLSCEEYPENETRKSQSFVPVPVAHSSRSATPLSNSLRSTRTAHSSALLTQPLYHNPDRPTLQFPQLDVGARSRRSSVVPLGRSHSMMTARRSSVPHAADLVPRTVSSPELGVVHPANPDLPPVQTNNYEPSGVLARAELDLGSFTSLQSLDSPATNHPIDQPRL